MARATHIKFSAKLLLLIPIISLTELFLLVWLTMATSIGVTIALVLLTGIVGAALVKREGVAVMARLRGDLGAGKLPADAVLDGIIVLLGGVLLMTPGVLTDIVGLSTLVPGVRRYYRSALSRAFKGKVASSFRMGPGFGGFRFGTRGPAAPPQESEARESVEGGGAPPRPNPFSQASPFDRVKH